MSNYKDLTNNRFFLAKMLFNCSSVSNDEFYKTYNPFCKVTELNKLISDYNLRVTLAGIAFLAVIFFNKL